MVNSEKQKWILEKAVEIYNQKGEIVIRELAQAAGINVASVNYYFGSKENLMAEVEKYLITAINDLIEPIEKEELPGKEKLKKVLYALTEYFVKNPGTIKYFYTILGINNEHNLLLLKHIVDRKNPYIQLCSRIIREETGITDEFEVFCRYLMFICSLVPPFLFCMLDTDMLRQLSDFMNVSYTEKEIPKDLLLKYMDTTIGLVLSKP